MTKASDIYGVKKAKWDPLPMFTALTKRVRSKLNVPSNWSASIYQFEDKRHLGINLSCQDDGNRTTHSWSINTIVPDETAVTENMLAFMELQEPPMRHLTDEEIVAKLQPYIDSKVNAALR